MMKINPKASVICQENNLMRPQKLFFIIALMKFQGINRLKMTQPLPVTFQGQLKHTHQLKKRIALHKKSDPKENGYLLINLQNIPQLTKHQSTTLKIGRRLKCLICFSTMNYLNFVLSMLYAKQSGNHSFVTDPKEMRVVLGILLLSGYNRLPRRRMYWEQCLDVRNTVAAIAMPRNRFDECLRYLHFEDNQNLSASDRYA